MHDEAEALSRFALVVKAADGVAEARRPAQREHIEIERTRRPAAISVGRLGAIAAVVEDAVVPYFDTRLIAQLVLGRNWIGTPLTAVPRD